MARFLLKVRKLKGKPPRVIIQKVLNKLKEEIYYKGRKIIISKKPIHIEDSLFKDFKSSCVFFFQPENKLHYLKKLKDLCVEEDIRKDAERVCNHVFNLLGSGDKNLGEKLPWNEDFKTGFIWDNQFYKDIEIIDLKNNADVKVPWELSRSQHIATLGKAYWLTSNEKYAIEFKDQLLDWIKNNPVEMSVNWTCTMDVAIRAVNWIIGHYFFQDSKVLNEKFWLDFNKSLYLHGKFIYKNLENKDGHTGNHYLSNIVGLIWIGLYFRELNIPSAKNQNQPKHWLEYGLKEIEKEMNVQVNKDGTNYEASTAYHRLVTELFLLTTILCTKNNLTFSKEFIERLEKMCEFILHLTQPNGKSPIIGDADDGRLTIFSNYAKWDKDDFRHLLAVGGEYFNRDDFRYFGSSFKEDALWINGDLNSSDSNPVLPSRSYENGGYYILRNERAYCSIRCGENSFRGEGVHSHNDQLSFTLNIDGEDIFVDPGAFIYTGDYKLRNLFRSTKMHNTLEIPGYEQNDFDSENLFYMKEQTFSECLEVDTNKFVGQHHGYVNKCGVIHKRSFLLGEKSIELKEELIGAKNQSSYKLNFILDSQTSINLSKNYIVIQKGDLTLMIQFNKEVKSKVEDVDISTSYGLKRKSKKLVIESVHDSLETTINFV
ncbi:alginate lyase family protein [Bacillus sp. RG28]|uniref:Alginate lyase family protein n=1 Tax=Gottfriedia endophytica TaxID=2820819 RepID=A0A940SJP4_9BACI|nr:alginate lyase family protein [Gottfriedia endophytica]MBP0725119.1 alginate lyase family protein [Gottfriedia endophytica]